MNIILLSVGILLIGHAAGQAVNQINDNDQTIDQSYDQLVNESYDILFNESYNLNIPEVKCTTQPMELVFVVDASTSLGQENFDRVKQVLLNVTASLHISDSASRVAVVSFATDAYLELNLDKYKDYQSLSEGIKKLRYFRGFTATAEALSLVRTQVLNTNARPNAGKLVIVITDGRTNYPGSRAQAVADLRKESDLLIKSGVEIHGVGVGSTLIEEDLRIMSTNKKYFLVNDYTSLLDRANELSKDICDVICHQLDPQTLPGQCFKGTQRMTSVTFFHDVKSQRCEKEISYEYKSCGKEVKCKDVEVVLGDCVFGFRNVITRWEEFNHYTLRCEPKSATERLNCQAIQQCAEPVADIIFLLDSSGSISDDDWYLQLTFVSTLLKDLKLGPNTIHVGVVAFATTVRNVIQLGGHSFSNSLIYNVQSIKHEKGWTATGKALNFVHGEFSKYGRPNVNQILILLTDGQSNDFQPDAKSKFSAIPEASKLQSSDVSLMVIGIGKAQTNAQFRNELAAIATPPLKDNLFFIQDFSKLKDWAQKISKETCESITPPNPTLCDLPPRRTVTECFNGIQKITEIRYVWDQSGRCTKRMLSFTTNPCKMVCEDPVNGNEYVEGESWISDCHYFTCKRTTSQTIETLLPTNQGCPGLDKQCRSPQNVPIPTKQAEYACRDERRQQQQRCYCLQDKNKTKIHIITADAKDQNP